MRFRNRTSPRQSRTTIAGVRISGPIEISAIRSASDEATHMVGRKTRRGNTPCPCARISERSFGRKDFVSIENSFFPDSKSEDSAGFGFILQRVAGLAQQ